MAIIFLNVSEEEFKNNTKPLHKHMSLESALNTLNNKVMWFANPTIWKDPFESRFVDAQYNRNGKLKPFPFKDRVFCACYTETAASEAYWTPYSQQQIGVEFVVNRKELLKQLELYADKYDIYIGKVEYMKTASIKRPLSMIPFSVPHPRVWTKEWCARLLLLKRNAYKYEDEMRIMIVKKEKTKAKGIMLEFNCEPTSLIERVILDPNLQEQTEILFKLIFEQYYKFKPIQNHLGKTYKRVVKSQLYAKKNVNVF